MARVVIGRKKLSQIHHLVKICRADLPHKGNELYIDSFMFMRRSLYGLEDKLSTNN